jgi:hypothetical protein
MELKNILHAYMSVAEREYARTFTYPSTLEGLTFRVPAHVRFELLDADTKGWSARVSHEGLGGKGCVVYVGRRPAPPTPTGLPARYPGVVTCDAVQ